MGFFSDLFKKKTFFYSDLPPEERIYRIVNEYIFPAIQAEGFEMNRKPLEIRRRRGIFEHKINFRKNKYNRTGEMASVEPYLIVEVKGYKKWYKDTYGKKDDEFDSGVVAGRPLRHIPGFSNKYTERGFFDFAEIDNVELTQLLRVSFKEHIVPYLDKYDSIPDVIELLIEKGNFRFFPMMFDLALMIKDTSKLGAIVMLFDDVMKSKEIGDITKAEMEFRKTYLKTKGSLEM